MNGPEGEKQAQKAGMLIGALAAIIILRRLRKRRKAKKLLKRRAKAKAKLAERRKKEQEAARRRRGRKGGKGRERSMLEQLVRFAVFQFLKKLITQQIKQMETDLGKGKLGKRIVEAAEGAAQ